VLVRKQVLILVLKYGLGFGLLAWVVWFHWDQTAPDGQPVGLSAALQKEIHFGPFFVALTICLASVLLTFYRWYLLVRAQELPFTPAKALRLGMIGYYFNTFLPGSVGGDIIKAACLASEQSRRTVAVATVLIDRVIGLCGLFWVAAFVGGSFWLSGAIDEMVADTAGAAFLKTVVLGASGIVVANLVFWFLLGVFPGAARFADRLERVPKVGHSLAEFWRAVWLYRRRGRSIVAALVLSMIGHSGFILMFYFAARTLSDVEVIPSLPAHFLLVPIGATIRAGFPSPGGVGGGEFGYGALYELLQFTFAAGVLSSLVFRVIECVWGFVGYLVYLWTKPALPIAESGETAATT
jgi:uncharacterized membrane protein YbhN (UPF0104 family)